MFLAEMIEIGPNLSAAIMVAFGALAGAFVLSTMIKHF